MTDITPPYIVQGAQGSVYPRLEITDLKKQEPKQFSLFIQALNNIQKPDYTSKGSDAANWAQIAGIHGAPYVKWSGDPKGEGQDPARNRWLGYCHHRDPLFPTWHRVNLLLLEQVIWNEARVIVETSNPSRRDEWLDAAKKLRFPFWDWTKEPTGDTYLPDFFEDSEILIESFTGGTKLVKNSLHTYHIPSELRKQTGWPRDNAPSFFTSWNRTYRWPEDRAIDPREDYNALNNAFLKGGPGARQHNVKWLRDKVAHLFTYRLDVEEKWGGNCWDFFSNVRYGSGNEPGPRQSPAPYEPMPPAIEEPHDTIHLNLGANGHMGSNDMAGFDPIFYLHHCNVDRIVAFWEYVYPKFWIGKGFYSPNDSKIHPFLNILGTFTQSAMKEIDSLSDLTPYRKELEKYWTSDDTHGLQPGQGMPKYYTYPPIGDVDILKPLKPEMQKLYIAQLQRHFGLQPTQPSRARPIFKAPIFQHPSAGDHGHFNNVPAKYEPLENFRTFVVVVTIDESEYDGSFYVELRAQAEPHVVVNRVSFLRRVDKTFCPACIGRQEQGSLARAVMILDSMEIQALLAAAGKNSQNTRDSEAIDVIKNAFVASVVAPSVTPVVLADSSPQYSRFSAGDPERGPTLKKGRPTLELYSAAAAQDDVTQHVEFYDWKFHAKLLDDEIHWVDRRQPR